MKNNQGTASLKPGPRTSIQVLHACGTDQDLCHPLLLPRVHVSRKLGHKWSWDSRHFDMGIKVSQVMF